MACNPDITNFYPVNVAAPWIGRTSSFLITLENTGTTAGSVTVDIDQGPASTSGGPRTFVTSVPFSGMESTEERSAQPSLTLSPGYVLVRATARADTSDVYDVRVVVV